MPKDYVLLRSLISRIPSRNNSSARKKNNRNKVLFPVEKETGLPFLRSAGRSNLLMTEIRLFIKSLIQKTLLSSGAILHHIPAFPFSSGTIPCTARFSGSARPVQPPGIHGILNRQTTFKRQLRQLSRHHIRKGSHIPHRLGHLPDECLMRFEFHCRWHNA
jgi:hypothetical protein